MYLVLISFTDQLIYNHTILTFVHLRLKLFRNELKTVIVNVDSKDDDI